MEIEGGLAVGGAGEGFFGPGSEDGGEVGRKDARAIWRIFWAAGEASARSVPMPTRWAPWPEKRRATLTTSTFHRLLNGRWIDKIRGGIEI